MIGELNALFSRIEASETVAVAVFDSADPDFFLAHYDIAEIANGDAEQVGTPPDQPHPWLTYLGLWTGAKTRRAQTLLRGRRGISCVARARHVLLATHVTPSCSALPHAKRMMQMVPASRL
jgi:hypothetical protein